MYVKPDVIIEQPYFFRGVLIDHKEKIVKESSFRCSNSKDAWDDAHLLAQRYHQERERKQFESGYKMGRDHGYVDAIKNLAGEQIVKKMLGPPHLV